MGTITVLARGGSDARRALERCRSVLAVVLDHSGTVWPTAEEWGRLLLEWFVAASSPELSREDVERWLAWWRTPGPADQARAESERRWALADCLYWMEPAERQWFWWDAELSGDGALRVTVEIPGWLPALGALDWLLRAAGAAEEVHEEVSSA